MWLADSKNPLLTCRRKGRTECHRLCRWYLCQSDDEFDDGPEFVRSSGTQEHFDWVIESPLGDVLELLISQNREE